MTKRRAELSKLPSIIVPSLTPPPQRASNHKMGCPALINTEGSAPYNIIGTLRQRNMDQMKYQRKTPEKELSNKKIDNLSDSKFNTLVIRMLTEIIEIVHKIKEEMKAIQSKIKENIQGINSEGKGTRTQINDLEQKEENKHPTRTE